MQESEGTGFMNLRTGSSSNRYKNIQTIHESSFI